MPLLFANWAAALAMRPAVELAEVDSGLALRARRALRGFPTDANEVVAVSVVLATRALAARVEEEARLVFVDVADVVDVAALSAFTALAFLLA